MFPGHIGPFPVSRVPDISVHVLYFRLFFYWFMLWSYYLHFCSNQNRKTPNQGGEPPSIHAVHHWLPLRTGDILCGDWLTCLLTPFVLFCKAYSFLLCPRQLKCYGIVMIDLRLEFAQWIFFFRGLTLQKHSGIVIFNHQLISASVTLLNQALIC